MMIAPDDALYLLLQKIGKYEMWLYYIDPLDGRLGPEAKAIVGLYHLGVVDVHAPVGQLIWKVSLTDRGRAWLDAAELDLEGTTIVTGTGSLAVWQGDKLLRRYEVVNR